MVGGADGGGPGGFGLERFGLGEIGGGGQDGGDLGGVLGGAGDHGQVAVVKPIREGGGSKQEKCKEMAHDGDLGRLIADFLIDSIGN